MTFAGFSYCGRRSLIAHADAASWPDIEVLAAGMGQAWTELASRAA